MIKGPGAISLILLLIAGVGSAAASGLTFPFDDLVRMSDVIVVGRLRHVHRVDGPVLMPAARDRHFEATIEVERTLWPENAPDSTRVIRWDQVSEGMVRSTDTYPERLEGKRVLWLLDVPRESRGKASYIPRGTIPLGDDTAVRAARVDLIAPRALSKDPRSTVPREPWKSHPKLERTKDLFDETLAELDSVWRAGR